eukprot:GHVN01056696.1.p2 GENE.GHVN01056696.1~~GHVN01056696.1.p2  ORF type:complete len:192 (+),score=20.53 GHVN01056696.1:1627-2202(+)
MSVQQGIRHRGSPAVKSKTDEIDLARHSTSVINLNQSVALNGRAGFASLSDILVSTVDGTHVLYSDVDEQILLKIVFKDPVSLTQAGFGAVPLDTVKASEGESEVKAIDASPPLLVKCFANCSELDFSEIDNIEPCQVMTLTADQVTNAEPISLRGSKFGRCHNVQFFIDANQKDTPYTFLTKVVLRGIVP